MAFCYVFAIMQTELTVYTFQSVEQPTLVKSVSCSFSIN